MLTICTRADPCDPPARRPFAADGRAHAPLPDDFGTRPLAVFLWDATGFLAVFILRDRL
jgi:hypothetical protein